MLNLSAERSLAREIAERGIAVAIHILPYHLQRTPPGFESGTAMISSDVPRMVRSIRQALLEMKALKAWLESRPEVNPQKIGLVGVSLGAIIGALARHKDDYAASVLVFGGADVANILWESPIGYKIKRGLIAKGYTEGRLREELAPVEPLNVLTPEDGRSVLMIAAEYDPVISYRSTAALRSALGNPPIIWTESGHYIPSWGRRKLYNLVADYFQSTLLGRETFSTPQVVRMNRVKLGAIFDREPFFAVGGAIELIKLKSAPFSLDLNLSTAGVGLGAAANVSPSMLIGIQRRVFPADDDFQPYIMLFIVL